jgi:hypothetical protein
MGKTFAFLIGVSLILIFLFTGIKENGYFNRHVDIDAIARVDSAKEVNHDFHVKVVPWSTIGFCIHFTNDNWKTITSIKDKNDNTDMIFLISRYSDGGEEKVFNEAIEFAKQFNTYQKCIDYNKQYKRLTKEIY